MKAPWLLAASLLLAHSCNSSAPATKSGNAIAEKTVTRASAVDEEIIRLVRDSQVAGFSRHDLAGYLAIWSDDATLIGGRGAEAAANDHVLNRAQIEATKNLLFSGPPSGVTLTPSNPKVEWKGEEAFLTWQMTTAQEGFRETVNELYKLRKTGKGWRVYENRYWLIEAGPIGAVARIDADYWAAKDAAVEAARRDGNKQAEVKALAEATRWSEAHQLSSQLIAGSEDAELWVSHMYLAISAGQSEDAIASACKVKLLKPERPLPAWTALESCGK